MQLERLWGGLVASSIFMSVFLNQVGIQVHTFPDQILKRSTVRHYDGFEVSEPYVVKKEERVNELK